MHEEDIARRLTELKAPWVLILAAMDGLITELRCTMPVCLAEVDNGWDPVQGRGYFVTTGAYEPWQPSPDRFPLLGHAGGKYVPENVRLAHWKCNAHDWHTNPIHAEARSAVGRKGAAAGAGFALFTPEQRSAYGRKAGAASAAAKTPEQLSAAGRKLNASLTPEQRSAISRKGGAARAASLNLNLTLEQRRKGGVARAPALTHTRWHVNRGIVLPGCELCSTPDP